MDSSKIELIARSIIYKDLESVCHTITQKSSELWNNLKSTGSELWLDTGDIEEASELWTLELSGLTTNNTLLNKEIQKGIYDAYIEVTNRHLEGLDKKTRIKEIAFILNARHGLILYKIFGCKVSVELHTCFAHDPAGILVYGKRLHDICPDSFIIKIFRTMFKPLIIC